jgi:heme/copper-type cytochrome/quinol oxidase subunit 2
MAMPLQGGSVGGWVGRGDSCHGLVVVVVVVVMVVVMVVVAVVLVVVAAAAAASSKPHERQKGRVHRCNG